LTGVEEGDIHALYTSVITHYDDLGRKERVRILEKRIAQMRKAPTESFRSFTSRVKEWEVECQLEEYVMDPDQFLNHIEEAIDADSDAEAVRLTVMQIAQGSIKTVGELLKLMGDPMQQKEQKARVEQARKQVNAATKKKKEKETVATAKAPTTQAYNAKNTASTDRGKKPCFKFAETGACKFGDKCYYEHVLVDADTLSKMKAKAEKRRAEKKKYQESQAAQRGSGSGTRSGKGGRGGKRAYNRKQHKAFMSKLSTWSDSEEEEEKHDDTDDSEDMMNAVTKMKELKKKHNLSKQAVIDIATKFQIC
jgi:hypothetical protein